MHFRHTFTILFFIKTQGRAVKVKSKKYLSVFIFSFILCCLPLAAQAGRPVGTLIKTADSPALYIMVPIGKAAHIPTLRV
ncbi:MAG: hypothetical protein D3924_15935, partial [Candidatus Electrothrix sp. AR4]|nr:hypothetical protein [Candidatus Electrothrix sp. AR4]